MRPAPLVPPGPPPERARPTTGIVTGAMAVVLSLVALYAILESLATRQGM